MLMLLLLLLLLLEDERDDDGDERGDDGLGERVHGDVDVDGDIDGDGDMDVLSASFTDDKVAWYENTDGKGTFSYQNTITAQANGATSVYAADIDGDGDVERDGDGDLVVDFSEGSSSSSV